jgi:hypothetical protein
MGANFCLWPFAAIGKVKYRTNRITAKHLKADARHNWKLRAAYGQKH